MIYRIIKFLNKLINDLIFIFLLVMLSVGSYGIYNSNIVYTSAKIDEKIVEHRPNGENNKTEFKQLKEFNNNIIAWINLNNTKIDYPIVKGTDNYEYLKKDYNGNYSASGAIYLDYRNSSDFSDKYMAIFGHHMSHGNMFGDLDKYRDKNFFYANKEGTLYLPNCTYKLEIFACGKFESMNQKIYNIDKYSDDDIRELNEYVKNYAMYYRNIEITENSRIIALSTCSGEKANMRFVVFALLE